MGGGDSWEGGGEGLLPAMVVAANRWSDDGEPGQETWIAERGRGRGRGRGRERERVGGGVGLGVFPVMVVAANRLE